ncbi:hypothetical protein SAMN04244575_06371 [Sinorhizobium meliloti]|nr:hypothetical protein SAMN04244575_06371 [Sinorhizobium meliloti]
MVGQCRLRSRRNRCRQPSEQRRCASHQVETSFTQKSLNLRPSPNAYCVPAFAAGDASSPPCCSGPCGTVRDLPPGGVRGQLVRDDAPGHHALLLHQPGQQALGALVLRRLWTISSRTYPSWSTARQRVLLASNADDHLIRCQTVMRARLLATEARGILRIEALSPSQDRLIPNDDAASSGNLLDQAAGTKEI